ncbi:MAG: polyphosphate kinase 2 [Planctomycetes bacterium]|nr:polyphosphate kinase 2 [Planctomycetota bacterium]
MDRDHDPARPAPGASDATPTKEDPTLDPQRPLRDEHGDRAVIYREEVETLDTREELLALLREKKVNVNKVMKTLEYEGQLEQLQVELVKLQRWVQDQNERLAIVFEGRDAAGKGGCIRRFTEHLNPRAMRVVALPKPTDVEKGQWYFQRYSRQLPNPGEIVFFDRSWYNRAVVEPVNDFCTEDDYERFMRQVPEFEHMLFEDGVKIVKFWFSISKREQLRRFRSRAKNPLKQWKLSPVDAKAQDLWDRYTAFKEEMMFSRTHTTFSPWIVVKANDKKKARLESIRHVLSSFPYEHREDAVVSIQPNPNIVMRFHRSTQQLD